MPNSRSVKWILTKCFVRQRSVHEPPFFFQEVRIGMLVVSILFNFSRLIYEATAKDISVILVAARLCLTTLQLVDHWWFCKNWESFFIEKKMRAYIWFRLFFTIFMFNMIYCVQKTFPPYTDDYRLKVDAFQWAAGLQVIIWYLWGKHWNFKWGDMSEERRIPAIVGTMFINTCSLTFGLACVYLVFTIIPSFEHAMISAITGTIAYFLTGLAFRYLQIITNQSSQACRKILDESKVAPVTDGHDPGSLPLQVVAERRSSYGIHRLSLLPFLPSARDHDDLMINLRQSLSSRNVKQSVGNRMEFSRRPEPSLAEEDDEDQVSGEKVEENHIEIVDEDEENGNIGRRSVREHIHPTCSVDDSLSHVISSSKNIDNDNGDNIGSVSATSNVGGDGVDMDVDIDFDRLRFKPIVFPPSTKLTISPDGWTSRTSKSTSPHESGGGDIESASESANQATGRIRLKPIHSTASAFSLSISHDSNLSHMDNSSRGSGSNKSIISNKPHDSGDNMGNASARGGDVDRIRDVLIDVPLARQSSLEANFATYETTHLLSDKIVVVFVQVKQDLTTLTQLH